MGNTTSLVLGFPIRTSSDQRSVGSSPRLIAASYVLHRPLMPRHPPCALKHLRHKKPIENKNQNCTSTHKKHPRTRRFGADNLRVRCSQPLSTSQTPHPTTKTGEATTTPTTPNGAVSPTPQRGEATGLLSQDPTVCLVTLSVNVLSQLTSVCCMHPPNKPTTGAGDNPNHELRHYCRHGGNPEGHVNGAP